MRIADLFKSKKAALSFEVFPPKAESGMEGINATLEELSALRPDYVSVTYGAGGSRNAHTAEVARKVRALSSEGGYVRGGVEKVIGFRPTTLRATNDFVFADIEVNARYVRIVVDGANAVAGVSGKYRVEIGELQVISSFDTNVDYVYPATENGGAA